MADHAGTGGARPGPWKSPKVLLLVGVWIGCVVAAVLFQATSPGFLAFRGVAELVEYHPSAPVAERVRSIPVEVGHWVAAGDVVAVLDPGPLAGQLAVLKAEQAEAEAALAAKLVETARQALADQRRFLDAVDGSEAALLKARTQLGADRAEREALEARIRWWKPQVEARSASGETLEELRAAAVALDRKVALDLQAVRSLEATVERQRGRVRAFEATAPEGDEGRAIEAGVSPYRAAVEVLRARVADAEARLAALTLRAPGEGVVYKIQVRPGDVVTPGTPVVQIRAPTTRRVLAYVSDVVATLVLPGTGATVVPRDGSGRKLRGRVLALGSGLRPLPEQALLNPNWREFGEEVVIELEDAGVLSPGQVVDVRFDLGGSMVPAADAATRPAPEAGGPLRTPREGQIRAASAADDGGASEAGRPPVPQAVEVPPGLRARTRVEPSGLVWVPELDRFLVVSDDTGTAEEDAHPAWLLVMDRTGRLDDRPLAIEGLDEISDLESITRAPDGTFWLLSSQAVSRKGKRPQARTLLVSVRLDGGRLKLAGQVSLAAALAGAGDGAWWASLGLSARAPGFRKGVAGFDRLLNIEGMTWEGDGLLLGLKRPVDEAGRALLWRLARPERLLATGRLDPGSLTVWARLPLAATVEGRTVPAGVSDLVRLPDGRLVVLAVVVGSDPGGTDAPKGDRGALLVVSGAPGAPAVKRVAEFDLKPEGVALGPGPGSLTVVFDRDAATPAWTTLAVPR